MVLFWNSNRYANEQNEIGDPNMKTNIYNFLVFTEEAIKQSGEKMASLTNSERKTGCSCVEK